MENTTAEAIISIQDYNSSNLGTQCSTYASLNRRVSNEDFIVHTTNYHSEIRQGLQIIWIVIAVVGFILNTAQIFWIISHHRKSVIDVFIVSLSVIDLQTCCFNIPFQVAELFYNFDWSIYGSKAGLACKFHWYFRHGSVISGSVMIALIAVSRYLAISDPMRRLKEKCSQMCINTVLAIIVWVGTISLVAPLATVTATINNNYFINQESEATSSPGGSQNETIVCYKVVQVCEQVETKLAPTIYGSMLFFVVPLVVLIASYSSLIRILVKRNHNRVLTYRGNSKHFGKSIVNSILGLFYIILVAPKGIYDIIKIHKFTQYEKTTQEEKWIDLVLYLVATTVVISNPVIYSFLTPRFFKFVETQSRRVSHIENPFRRGSLLSTFSAIDWNSTHKHFFNRKWQSHEKLHSVSESDESHHYSRQETIKTILSDTSEVTENTAIILEENNDIQDDSIPALVHQNYSVINEVQSNRQASNRRKVLVRQKSVICKKVTSQDRVRPFHAVASSAWLTSKATETRLTDYRKCTDVHYATL